MPQLTPKNPPQAAQHYAAALRTGCALGAVSLSFLRELAILSPELRHQLGVYFGIMERDGSPAEVRLPQLRKQFPVLLVTGTKTKTVLEQVTFVGTKKGFWRIQYASGERATITRDRTSCWTPTGRSTYSPKPRRP